MDNSFDNKFNALPEYQQFPFFVPFVGDNYKSTKHKKLLLVAESHYLDQESTIHLDPQKWYGEKNIASKLTEKELGWCTTKSIGNGETDAKLLESLGSALHEVLGTSGCWADAFSHVAYFNFFLRPAKYEKGKYFSLDAKTFEKKRSASLLWKNMDILDNDIVILLSKGVMTSAEKYFEHEKRFKPSSKGFYERFWKALDEKYIKGTYIYHPSRFWGQVCHPKNNENLYNGMTTKSFFIDFLKKSWLV